MPTHSVKLHISSYVCDWWLAIALQRPLNSIVLFMWTYWLVFLSSGTTLIFVIPIKMGVGFLPTLIGLKYKGKLSSPPGKFGDVFANRLHFKCISEANMWELNY